MYHDDENDETTAEIEKYRKSLEAKFMEAVYNLHMERIDCRYLADLQRKAEYDAMHMIEQFGSD